MSSTCSTRSPTSFGASSLAAGSSKVKKHKAAKVKLVTFPLEAFQTSLRFQVPSWSVYLSIHWFSQVHSEILVSGGAQSLSRKLQPQGALLWQPLQEGCCYVSSPCFLQRGQLETDKSIERLNLLVVGLAVVSSPFKASTSLKPLTTSLAFARGVLSSFLLHLSKIRLVRVRSGTASISSN